MPAGIPISAGTSKVSIALTNVIIQTARTAGSRIRRVIRNVVRTIPEPATIAASSKAGSMERNAAASKRKVRGI